MAKSKSTLQPYDRISGGSKFDGYLDVSHLVEHNDKIDLDILKSMIKKGIEYANLKSVRDVSFELRGATEDEQHKKFNVEGRKLFSYFIKYCGDPASTAYDCYKKHYKQAALSAFRNRVTQMERMNAGWRYQYISKEAASKSKRFDSVSDLNLQEADFVATISYKHIDKKKLNIYVSVKNRSNTMGGQDWPKAIRALEETAFTDKNREGAYICVFGIAMEKGARSIRSGQKSKVPYSYNTEIWFSDFFWPFFSNYTYEEISKAVLDVLIEAELPSSLNTIIPDEVMDVFRRLCYENGLIDDSGIFQDPFALVEVFCGKKLHQNPKAVKVKAASKEKQIKSATPAKRIKTKEK